ncbi:MAG: hypothetical protein WA610_13475 [Thermodesulfovibrionales bacterium]
MKQGLLTRFDRLMAAVTFAEEGEFETARAIMREGDRTEKRLSGKPEMRKQQPLRKSH